MFQMFQKKGLFQMFQKNSKISTKRYTSTISQSIQKKRNESRNNQKYTARKLSKEHRF